MTDGEPVGTIEKGPDGRFKFAGDEPRLKRLAALYSELAVEAHGHDPDKVTVDDVLGVMLQRMGRGHRTWAEETPLTKAEKYGNQARTAAALAILEHRLQEIESGQEFEDADEHRSALAELADDPEELGKALGHVDLSWVAYGTSRSGKKRWRDEETGKLRYQETRPGEHSEKRQKAQADAAKGKLHLDKIVRGNADADDLRGLAQHVGAMTRQQLTEVRQKLRARFKNGAKRDEMVQALRSHVAGKVGRGETHVPESEQKKPKEPERPPLPPIDYQHVDPNHPVAKQIAADYDSQKAFHDFMGRIAQVEQASKDYESTIDQLRDKREAVDQLFLKWNAAGSRSEKIKLTKERKALEREVESLRGQMNTLGDVHWWGAREQFRKHFAEAMLAAHGSPSTIDRKPPSQSVAGQWGYEPFEDQHTPELDTAFKWLEQVTGGGGTHRITLGRATGARPFFNQSAADGLPIVTSRVFGNAGMGGVDTVTLAHEFGHYLEHADPEIRKAAHEFLDYRLQGEKPQNLLALFPESGYESHEEGAKDRFDKVFGSGSSAYYVGKPYGDGSTELVSMGLQQLYDDPAKFAKADPEYFQFMVSVLRGAHDAKRETQKP